MYVNTVLILLFKLEKGGEGGKEGEREREREEKKVEEEEEEEGEEEEHWTGAPLEPVLSHSQQRHRLCCWKSIWERHL